ncbi:MAG: hypothetical protein JRH20_19130, partial [Deltaproteobacteria bacterium]|nr:hypothetical protein [Deltaproteobacteria bacterium]
MSTYSAAALARPRGQRVVTAPLPILELLERARWAPSGDNCQPWRVHHVAGGLQISLDAEPTGFLDQGPATAITLGAFAESCRLAAEHLHIASEVDLQEVGAHQAFVACGKALAATPLGGSLGAALPHRCSNRQLYATGSCQTSELRSLAMEVADIADVQVDFISGHALTPLSKVVALAEKVRLRHRQCHEEFHAKIRWTAEEAEVDPTGFWVETFEIKKHEAWLLHQTRRWWVFRAADVLLRFGDLVARAARKQVQNSGAVVLFSVPRQDPQAWGNVGRALQRVWLRAAALGLSGQVLGVPPILMHKRRQGGDALAPGQKSAVLRAEE